MIGVHERPPNPSELLASDPMHALLDELRRHYDRVVVDTPAALGLPDAKIVSDLCDGHVLVVAAHRTPLVDVERALGVLDRRRLLGRILNDAGASVRG